MSIKLCLYILYSNISINISGLWIKMSTIISQLHIIYLQKENLIQQHRKNLKSIKSTFLLKKKKYIYIY